MFPAGVLTVEEMPLKSVCPSKCPQQTGRAAVFIFTRKTVQQAEVLIFKLTWRGFASGQAQAEPGMRSRD